MKKAIITGINGQDGAYLASFLLNIGYTVIGFTRKKSSIFKGLEYLKILDKIEIVECDLLKINKVAELLSVIQPDEIYNLAAQSSVYKSYKEPINTFEFNIISMKTTLNKISKIGNSWSQHLFSSDCAFEILRSTLPPCERSQNSHRHFKHIAH